MHQNAVSPLMLYYDDCDGDVDDEQEGVVVVETKSGGSSSVFDRLTQEMENSE